MRILVVDDEKGIRTSIKFFLQGEGYAVETAASGEEAMEKFGQLHPEVVILDINLPGMDGIEVLSQIKKLVKDTIVIMITYRGEVKLAVNAMKKGAYDYFIKPFFIGDIQKAVQEGLHYQKITRSINEPIAAGKVESGLNEFIGESPKVRELKRKVSKLVDLNMDTNILITGSSGTGKEILAQYVHQAVSNKKSPYVAVNCAAIPKTLQESEFFGYEKGAFTEAKAQKVGLIEKANGGTLFLDEVADMDLELQAKMLRVLQEKTLRRVGGLEEINFSATVIAATNKDLRQEIAAGNFREDLFYRLNVVPLDLPDLAQRKEDIPLLVDHFVKEYNQRLSKNIEGLSEQAMKKIMIYPWPGNIRELKNLIERVMIFQDNLIIDVNDLPEELIEIDEMGDMGVSPASLDMAQAEIIRKALYENDWNITRTSEELGISRLTLRKKIQKYALEK